MKFQITFLPQNVVTHAPEGTTVFNAANWAGLAIDSTCGGRGTCGKCKVRFLQGVDGVTEADHRFLSEAELAEGWRLSCRAPLHADCLAEVPRLMTSPKAALLGYGQHVILNPNVAKVHLQLAEPTLEDQQSDLARLVEALDVEGYEVRVDPAVWRALPKTLRNSNFSITAVVCGDELIAVEPGDTTGQLYGLSLDIGTTTVVGAVVNLNTGAVEAVKSTLNGQAPYGADVISRVSHTMMEPEGLAALHTRIVETINALFDELLGMSGVTREDVYEVVVVGNATMIHLLLGIDPEPISVAPFIPAINEPVTLPAAEIGLKMHPQARLSTLPHLGAYVGADIVAGVLATGVVRNKDEKLRLYIDVGTNGEIVLGSARRALATAAPAGPAFEGAQIKCGMRASDGAIEGVQINGGAVHLQIIGGAVHPIGLCGSGLVDAAAELVKCGLVDASGRLLKPDEARGRGLPEGLIARLVTVDGARAFLLTEPQDNIVLTQPDIRALQFAKGAIAAGVNVLLAHMGVTAGDLREVLLAGSFGSYINPASARLIGLVPWVPVERIVAVGNAAGEGAKICLLSFRERQAANRLPEFIEYLELSGRSEFNDIFTEALGFPVRTA
ncbi:MAG TPA: ASKHA domain-containing protein [Anaerolineales bacterium]|nr:ASKHA domain-containing protein [Anaerolineales bacterium]